MPDDKIQAGDKKSAAAIHGQPVSAAEPIPGAKPGDVASESACPGEMSQQGMGTHGNESVPQKLLQLVGYRDPTSAAGKLPHLRKAGRRTLKEPIG